MIPLHLSISGFLSYQNPVDISFENIHLACISGANGAGKSSILDAITWVVFGVARSKNDAIINQNSSMAELRLDFLYENQRYRIQRAKAANKSQVLEFQVFEASSDSWRPLTEHSLTETQKRIESILRMDYDTFTNASFFLQGKADQFTQLAPGRRKEILSNILGLEIWEDYRALTREKRRETEQQQQRLLSLIDEAEKELAEEPQTLQRIAQFQTELSEKQAQKSLLNQMLEQSKQLTQTRGFILETIKNLQENIRENNLEIDLLNQKISAWNTEKEQHEQFLSRENEIKQAYSEWKSVRDQLSTLQNKSVLFYQSQQKISTAQSEIKNEARLLSTELETLTEEQVQIESIKTELPQLNENLITLTKKQQEMETALAQKEALQKNLEETQSHFSTKRSEITQSENALKTLRKKYQDFHQAGPTCPFCNQPLTEDHREKYETHLTEEGNQIKQQIKNLESETETLQKEITLLRENLQRLAQKQQENQALTIQITTANLEIKQKKSLVETWEDKKANRLIEIEETLSNNTFAAAARETITHLTQKISELDYDSQQHESLKSRETQLQKSEPENQSLEIAKARLGSINDQILDAEARKKTIQTEQEKFDTQLTEQKQLVPDKNEDTPDQKQLEIDLDQKQIEINRLNQFMGAEQQKINYLKNKREQLIKYTAENDQLIVKINRYKNLEDAFGKNGVPALLIEQSLPEIENHANDYLERLTNGNMSIKFQTQSEYKDKKRTDKKETLDILISDQSGHYRAYEMFSGGEAFRINFAIRLALSQVLAKRAGARLQTLVIDEGFGSQDIEGRQRLVEAINLVQKDFERVLVITHLEELKEVFPTRIEVQKTTSGSVIEVINR